MAASSYRLGGLGSDTISDATGQLHVHLSCPHLPALLHRAMTAATCLVTASPTGLSAGRQQRQPSHSFSRCSGEEESPSICTGTSVISVPSPQEHVWRQPQSSLRLWTGDRQDKETRLLVSLPELFRAQSILTQDSKAVWVNSWESHEQTQERTTSAESSACCHHPQRQSWVSAMHGKPCPQSWETVLLT